MQVIQEQLVLRGGVAANASHLSNLYLLLLFSLSFSWMNSLLKEKARLAKHYGNYLERYVVKATSIKLKPLKPKHVDSEWF